MTAATTGISIGTGAAARTTRRAGVWHSPAVRRRSVDLGCVAALLAVGAVSWGPVFGSHVGYVAAGGGSALGIAIAVVAAWRHWTRLGTLLAVMITYLVGGGPLALPETTIGGILPRIETIQRLTLLSWQSWRDLLTVAVPAGEFDGPSVLPYLVGLVTAAVSTSAALRTRRLAVAAPITLLATLGLLTIGILWGSHQAPLAALQGGLFGAVGLGWVSWRSQLTDPGATAIFRSAGTTRPPRIRRTVSAVAALTVAAGASGAAWTVLAPDPDRHVLRDGVTPPFDIHDYPSPLTGYRFLELKLEDETLLTVDGLPDGSRIRLAAMDAYDGDVYNVSGSSGEFAPTGETIAPGRYADSTASLTHLSIDVGAYSGVWLPGGGDVRSVVFADNEAAAHGLFYSDVSGTALTTARVTEGDHYEVDVALAATYSDDDKSALPGDAAPDLTFPIPDTTVRVDSVGGASGELRGNAETPLGQLLSLEAGLRNGFYANGAKDNPSYAGHSAGRIDRLLKPENGQMVGDDEQYAVAMALMARELGLPARVVMGFYPDPDEPFVDGPIELTGDDAHVWVEVLFEDHGWVNFDPTPPEDRTPEQKQERPEPKEEPQVLPPPEVPEDHDLQRPPRKDSDEKQDAEDDRSVVLVALIAAAIAAGTVTLLFGPFVLVAYLKRRRRRRRRNARVIADRISGGWAEIVDLAVDLGVRIPPPATRYESAVLLKDRLPPTSTMPIAHRVDAHVFGDGEPTTGDVDAVWASVDALRNDFRKTATVRDRIRQRFSLRSLMRRPGQPARGQTQAKPRG